MPVYSSPKEVKVPKLDFKDIPKYEKECDQYLVDLKEWCNNRNPSENVGEIISFAVADGSAQYMVAALKPIQLIHIEIWDAYSYPDVSKYKAKDILLKIQQQKNLVKLFSKK